jgi:hypothetical protein
MVETVTKTSHPFKRKRLPVDKKKFQSRQFFTCNSTPEELGEMAMMVMEVPAFRDGVAFIQTVGSFGSRRSSC